MNREDPSKMIATDSFRENRFCQKGEEAGMGLKKTGLLLVVLLSLFVMLLLIRVVNVRGAENVHSLYSSRLIITQDSGAHFVYYTNDYRYEADRDVYVLVMKTGKWLLDEKTGIGLEFNELRLSVPRRLSIVIQPLDGTPR